MCLPFFFFFFFFFFFKKCDFLELFHGSLIVLFSNQKGVYCLGKDIF